MKYFIIILVIILTFLLFTRENFDNSANLNLLPGYSAQNLSEKRIPMTMFSKEVNDLETPNMVEFDKRITITDLQKLKAINNILDRIKEVNQAKIFNSNLLPVKIFKPSTNNLSYINNYVFEKLLYYSGDQYELTVKDMSNVSANETDAQYKIDYVINGSVDNMNVDIIVSIVIDRPVSEKPNISFNELRIDNPSIYITPNKYDDNHALISDYS